MSLLLASLTTLSLAFAPKSDSFPHAAHRRLFASCTTCHSGIVSGDSAASRPAPAACGACHDGTLARRVDWTPAPPRPTNLRFDHRAHIRDVRSRGDSALACTACHAAARAASFMDVGAAKTETCLGCHTHQAPAHLASNNDCSTCHRTLHNAVRLAAADIARFPKPPWHDSGYVWTHGPQGNSVTCAFCHTRDFCATCHVNAGRVPAIAALPADARVASLVTMRTSSDYPEPASHARADFTRSHGALASQPGATCASCHARESCVGCHSTAERLAAINALPRRTPGGAPGVEIAARRPEGHGAGFSMSHRTEASPNASSCASCHAPSYCSTCHDASASPRFHGADFVQRHAAESFGNTSECSTCHQPQAFCTRCHVETGRARTGATAGKYHDAQPNWTFAHGAVARRAIESCASCHRQQDCLQCHASGRGWGVNPHGPGFNPGIEAKNPAMCTRCHVNGPPRG